jgi:diguanylate cyclase (GGDEF)-like protein/PAS domain S-box-containing protein
VLRPALSGACESRANVLPVLAVHPVNWGLFSGVKPSPPTRLWARLMSWLHAWTQVHLDRARTPDTTRRIDGETPSHHAFLPSLIDHLPVLVFVKKLRGVDAGRMQLWNKTAEAVTGYAAADVMGKTNDQAFHPEVAKAYAMRDSQMVADPMIVEEFDVKFHRPDGGKRILHTISVPLFDEQDQPEYMLTIAEDITERHRQQTLLRSRQAELYAANDASPLGLFRTDPQGRCTYVNRTYEIMSGLEHDEAVNTGWIQAVHPQDRLKLFQEWQRSARAKGPLQATYRFRHRDERIVWVSARTAPIVVDGRIEGYAGSVDDITARREAEQALAESEQRLRTIADTVPTLVAYLDRDQRFRFVNLAFERAYGINRDAIRDCRIVDILGHEAYQILKPYIDRVLNGEHVSFEQESGHGDAWSCSEATFIPQHDDHGVAVVGFHAMVQDITSKRLEERRLLQLAHLDSLTGVLNRGGFDSKMQAALEGSRRDASLLAVMYLDVDHFKRINDTHGHHIGDLLLKAFSGRLKQMLRTTDTVARLGGDEFTILMEEMVRAEDAEAIAAKIVQAMQPPFVLEGVTVAVTISIGVAFCQSGDTTQTALLRLADEMLYLAKEAGRGCYRVAPPGTPLKNPALEDRPAA